MAKKEYSYITTVRTAQPRSTRRDASADGGSSTSVSISVSGSGTASASGDGHTHDNKDVLDAQSMDSDGYLYLRRRNEETGEVVVEKVKAGEADHAASAAALDDDSKVWDKLKELFLSRVDDDTANGLITFLKGIKIGKLFGFDKGGNLVAYSVSSDNYDADSRKGFTIAVKDKETGRYRLCIDELAAWTAATVGSLLVKGDSVFNGQLSSPDFVSGFLAGKGWRIKGETVTNSAGAEETKWTEEIDNLTVRGALRVYEMVISQLLGENDNRVFTAMLEVDHYDADSGKVYLDTYDGKYYNPFRVDDYIMVQQYNGIPSADNGHYVTKHYELIVTEAGSEGSGEDMLAWVKFRNFTTTTEGGTPATLIAKKDTFVRVDNLSDPGRKGIVAVTTVGSDTPYIDIIHSLKTDPDNALKGRLGNLAGIVHPLFGTLAGFGELLQNLYAVGDFRLRRTGESVDAKIEMLKGMFATAYQRTAYDLTEEDNYLKNATFTGSMDGWSTEADDTIIGIGGEPLLLNGGTLNTTGGTAAIVEYEGRNVLRLKGTYVRQANADIRKPGTHKEYTAAAGGDTSEAYTEVKDTLYMSVRFLARTDGTLYAGFEGAGQESGALPLAETDVTASTDWQVMQWSGTWDGTGDFVLRYSGEMYVSLLAVTDKALDDFKKSVSTKIEQTDSNIRLLGTNIDNVKGTATQLGIDLDAAEERITLYADKTSALESTVAQIQVNVDSISSTVTSVQGDLDDAKATAAAASKAAQTAADDAMARANSASSAASGAQSTADAAQAQATKNATAISQNANAISLVAAKFNSDGSLANTSGLVTTATYQSLYSQVQDIDGTLAAKADISTSVQYNPSTGAVTSNIKLTADQIDLTGAVTFSMLSSDTQSAINGKASQSSLNSTNSTVSSLSSSLSSTNSSLSSLKGSLGSAAYWDSMADAMYNGKTFISGGYIRSELLDVTKIAAVEGTIGGIAIHDYYLGAQISSNGSTTASQIFLTPGVMAVSGAGGSVRVFANSAASAKLNVYAPSGSTGYGIDIVNNGTGRALHIDNPNSTYAIEAASGSVAVTKGYVCAAYEWGGYGGTLDANAPMYSKRYFAGGTIKTSDGSKKIIPSDKGNSTSAALASRDKGDAHCMYIKGSNGYWYEMHGN